MNFNVKEFTDLYQQINEWNSVIRDRASSYTNLSNQLTELIDSDDSDISEASRLIGEGVNFLCSMLNSAFENLMSRMKEYETLTLMNEKEVSNKVVEVETLLRDVMSQLDSIGGR